MKQKLLLLVALLCCAFNAKAASEVKFYGTEISQNGGYYFICNATSGKFLNDDGTYSTFDPNKEDPTNYIYDPGSKPTVWCITQNSDGTITISSGSKSIFISVTPGISSATASATIATSSSANNASNHLKFKKSTHADGPGNTNTTCYQFFHAISETFGTFIQIKRNFAGVLNGSDHGSDVFEALGEAWTGNTELSTENLSQTTRWVLLNTNVRANLTVSGTAKYGTFVAPFEVTLPTGISAFKVTGYDESTQELQLENATDATNKLPANTAVIVYGESTLTKDYYGNPAGNQNANSGSYLVGTYETTPAPVGSFLLQYRTEPEPEAIFLYVDGSETLNCGKNRAYLTGIAPAGVKSLNLSGLETSIEVVKAADNIEEDTAIYDLSGRRLSQKPARGLYIQNGKKILVK